MRVRGCGERDPLLYRQLNNPIAGIMLVHRLAPSSGGKLNREVSRPNEIECLIDQTANLCAWPMTVDFDQIQMGEAINQPRRCYFADTAKIIGVHRIDIPAFELRGAIRYAVDHLIGAIKEMNRAQDKIEFVPM